jgi:hypothetical protein
MLQFKLKIKIPNKQNLPLSEPLQINEEENLNNIKKYFNYGSSYKRQLKYNMIERLLIENQSCKVCGMR